MFNLLSNQTKLLTLLGCYSSQDIEVVSENLKLIIKLLSRSVTDLLEHRRISGVLLPQESNNIAELSHESIQALNCAQLLLNQEYLIKTINSFCLTEAIIIRNNFSNCLEFLTDEALQTSPLATIKEKKKETKNTNQVDTNNVSPIRLTEIKQRLAQAVQTPDNKKEQIKNRLNNLLAASQAATENLAKHA